MNAARVLLVLASSGVLASCGGQCLAPCVGTLDVQLIEVPDSPYEITIELPDRTLSWSCDGSPSDDPDADCENGHFVTFDNQERASTASVTIDGFTADVDGDCEEQKICGQKCWSCTFVVD